jgi:hypothetical protein
MTPKSRRWTLALIAAVAVLFLAGWAFVDVTARKSSFCIKCHYMVPYVEQWKASKHAGVECVKCHPTNRRAMLAQFLKYNTGTYSPRPRAYVPDSACTQSGCHADMPTNKSVKFLTVSFPHEPHLAKDKRGIKLQCASCHGSSQEAGHVSVDPKVCFLCHFKGQPPGGTVAGCGACHGAPGGISKHGGFSFDMKAYVDSGVACARCHLSVHEGTGAVSKDKCYSCHVSRVEMIGEPVMLHEKHVDQKEVRCLECHEPIRHGNIKLISVMDVSCESCHANMHGGPKEMYLGVGAKGATSTPSRMFAAQINCTGCHTQVTTQGGVSFLGQGTAAADPKACAACHDSRYVPMVERWKADGKTLAAEARRMALQGAQLAGKAKPGSPALQLAADLQFNAKFLETGHPVHNIEYAIKVLQASSSLLKQVGEATGSKVDGAIQTPFAKTSFSYCQESCHTFIPRQEPYAWNGVDVPHTYHIQKAGLSCDTCHAEGRHKELALSSPADCSGCHHSDAKADCARCHVKQAGLYRGKVPAALALPAKADQMAEAVGCADCHDPTKPDALKAVGKACAGCHEAKYEKTLEEWKSKLAAGRESVQSVAIQAGLAVQTLKRQGGDVAAYQRKLDDIHARLQFLDQAKGIHNLDAALAEYDRDKRELQLIVDQASKAVGPGLPAPKPGWEKKK